MDIVWGGILGPDPSGCEVTLVDNGSDWGARINAADVALGSKAGAICCQGGGNIATQIILNTGASSLRTLRFGPGTWTNSIPPTPPDGLETIVPHDNTLIEGHGWDTILQEANGSNPLSYFLIRPLNAASQRANISVRNIQLSGVGITKGGNGVAATVNTGLLNGGTYQNIWFNKTHAIGLTIGESNYIVGGPFCRNVGVLGCKFTNVGGATPPDYVGGGGVSLAIINGDQILVDGCTFIDALGNTVIDLEPNNLTDPITNITISNCIISQEMTTGNCALYVYGFAAHTAAGIGSGDRPPVGPIKIIGCAFRGAYGRNGGDPGDCFPSGHLISGIYVNFGVDPGQSYKVTAENNTIQACSAWPFIIDGANDNVFKNNTCIMIQNDAIISGLRNTISGNYIVTTNTEPAAFNHIVETGASSDYNSFLNDTVVAATTVIGTHSTVSGESVIARPSFTPVYTPLPSGTITTTNANDVMIAIAQELGHISVLVPLTALQNSNQPQPLGYVGFAPGYQVLTSAGSYSASWTNTETRQWLVAILALKGSATLVQQIDAGQMIWGQPTLTPSTTGGSLGTGIYYYRWAGIYNGGEFLALENSVSVTGPTGSVAIVASPLNGPTFPSYKIYRGTSPGVYTVYYTTTATSFTDIGAAGTAGSPPSALAYTGTLGATPTNGNAIAVTYGYQAHTPTSVDLSTVSVGGVALAKGPSVTTPWGIASIWHKENVQGATNGIVTATLVGNPPGQTDKIWFNASELSGVVTTNAVDVQTTNSFPTTW